MPVALGIDFKSSRTSSNNGFLLIDLKTLFIFLFKKLSLVRPEAVALLPAFTNFLSPIEYFSSKAASCAVLVLIQSSGDPLRSFAASKLAVAISIAFLVPISGATPKYSEASSAINLARTLAS